MKSFPTLDSFAALGLLLATVLVPLRGAHRNGGHGSPSSESRSAGADSHRLVHGVTISCQTWGWEWGSEGFGEELDRLRGLGANWVAIHPYASVRADGTVGSLRHPLDPAEPPEYLTSPLAEARRRGMAFLVKPHLAYWGSPFRWRGEIGFEEESERARFWEGYSAWVVSLAEVTKATDAFCIGTELDRMLADEVQWRELIARVRAVTPAQLTYAANWDRFEEVPFWDALDAIGIQAYFPLLAEGVEPSEDALRAGWAKVLPPLEALSERVGKPVVFTELGFSDSPAAAVRPWEDPQRGDELQDGLQARCLGVALEVIQREHTWLRGAFLWKWFVGRPHREDSGFYLDTPHLRAVIEDAWKD